MEHQDEQLCASCDQLNLAAIFDPDHLETLPRFDIDSLNALELESLLPYSQHTIKTALENPSPTWIRHLGHWNPPGPNASDIGPRCLFCALLIDMAERGPPNYRNRSREILALPSHVLYDLTESGGTVELAGCSISTSSTLLVVNLNLLVLLHAKDEKGWKDWVRLMIENPFITISRVPDAPPGISPSPVLADPRFLRQGSIDYHGISRSLAICASQHGNTCAARAGPPVSRLKLIDCQARRIINALPGMSYDYVALSYVWGKGPLEPYVYPMLPESLPLVIRDAMALVLRLGLQYLWVDRYCIWQDEPGQTHKMSQVSRMDQIYGGAHLTIYACAGEDPSFGLPGVSTRQRSEFQLCKTIGGMTLVTTRGHHKQTERISGSRWKSRGWTFQEEALSRRRLYITDYQTSFVCSKMTCFEHLESPLSFNSNTGDDKRPFWNDINIPHGIWPLISRYSTRQLTYQSDRISAISGVLNQWSQSHPNCFHYWGVPIIGAPSCWQLSADVYTNGDPIDYESMFVGNKLTKGFLVGLYVVPDATITRQINARNRHFPSWSWAGQGTNLRFPVWKHYETEANSLVYSANGFDAEVWVERPDGTTVEWERFVSTGGCSLPDRTPYLHVEGWIFTVGPFQRRTLEERSPRAPFFCIPASGNYQESPKRVRQFHPDSVPDASSTLSKLEFTAISFEPLETAERALVMDTVGSALERIGILEFFVQEVANDDAQQAGIRDKSRKLELDDALPQAHRRRIRLG